MFAHLFGHFGSIDGLTMADKTKPHVWCASRPNDAHTETGKKRQKRDKKRG